jgi:hypothetical protein
MTRSSSRTPSSGEIETASAVPITKRLIHATAAEIGFYRSPLQQLTCCSLLRLPLKS